MYLVIFGMIVMMFGEVSYNIVIVGEIMVMFGKASYIIEHIPCNYWYNCDDVC